MVVDTPLSAAVSRLSRWDGFHLIAGTLNQAALARRRAGLAAAAWLLCAVLFVAWMVSPVESGEVLRVETGYFDVTALLCMLLVGARIEAPPASIRETPPTAV